MVETDLDKKIAERRVQKELMEDKDVSKENELLVTETLKYFEFYYPLHNLDKVIERTNELISKALDYKMKQKRSSKSIFRTSARIKIGMRNKTILIS